mgnify:CR=1 FL=1
MEYVKNQILPAVYSSVKDKLMSTAKNYLCEDDPNKFHVKVKRMGVNKSVGKRLGFSNQSPLRKLK